MSRIPQRRDDRSGSPSTPKAHASSERVLRLPQVCQVTGLGRSFIYQLQAEKRFPQRIKLGVRAVGWIEGEVQSWLAAQIAGSQGALV